MRIRSSSLSNQNDLTELLKNIKQGGSWRLLLDTVYLLEPLPPTYSILP